MKLLALDSSTEWISVAAGDGESWHSRDERASNAHSERVLPLVREVLASAGWRLSDLDAVAFGAGPGAFTGVRIACGIAQGLGLGAGLPVVAIPTLEALAEEAFRQHGYERLLAVLDARMQEVYAAAYRRDGDGWQCVQAPAVLKPADVVVPVGAWAGAGDGFAQYPELATRLALVAADAGMRPSARAVAMLALPRVAAGHAVAARDALPLYVRHRVALTCAERDAGARL
ncbi:MAG: tRNA (adenosine(37)-N6)-threonylcarbamoyltransferase complex dimerization subunit type 1 TsaB [Casimicrobiaceae bacterium]